MADKNDGMDQMMKFWQNSQDAFFDAQKEMAETFGRAFAPKPKDPMTKSYEAWQEFIKAWAPGWDPSAMMKNQAFMPQSPTAFYAMYDPSSWMSKAPDQLRAILESVVQFPKFADMAAPQAEGAEQWQEYLDFQEATTDFAKVMHEAWQRAYQRYGEKFSIEDLKTGNVQKALDAWVRTANEELLDTQSTQKFMDAQRKMIVASNGLKLRQAKMAEAWSDIYQMPTRSEIDDLTKTVTELKRDIRNLKRELAQKK